MGKAFTPAFRGLFVEQKDITISKPCICYIAPANQNLVASSRTHQACNSLTEVIIASLVSCLYRRSHGDTQYMHANVSTRNHFSLLSHLRSGPPHLYVPPNLTVLACLDHALLEHVVPPLGVGRVAALVELRSVGS